MKVESQTATSAGAARAVEPALPSTAASSPAAAFVNNADGVELSEASTVLSRLLSARNSKLQQVSAAVQKGAYKPSSEAISRALVAYVLSGSQPRRDTPDDGEDRP